MRLALQWILSLIFNIQMYLALFVVGIVFLPWAIISRKGARAACIVYCRWVRFSLRWLTGLKTELRGEIPRGEVIIAAKHQSFLDIIMIFSEVTGAKFIMKRELMWAPILGFYAMRIGCVPVARGQRGRGVLKMKTDVQNGLQHAGQLVIYPQGTRTAPGEIQPYKSGVGALYAMLKQDCVPAAVNVGVFWPKRSVMRKPGLAVIEFLPTIPAGLRASVFMAELEARVEEASDRLMAEAGFIAPKA